MEDRWVDNLRMGKFPLDLNKNLAKTPGNSQRDIPPTQEDHRARFFEHYRKEAEEYDREFMKKYDEDLNTTLIFVSFTRGSYEHALKSFVGWSVFRRCLSIHPRCPISTPARHG